MSRKKAAKSKKQDRFGAVVLHFGYVESSAVSPMILLHQAGGLPTKLETIQSLANWFFLKWCEDNEFDPEAGLDECCEAARAKAAKSKRPPRYCDQCGCPLDQEPGFSPDDYRTWISSLGSATADSFGWDGMGESEWTPWCKFDEILRSGKIIEIIENAEDVLTYALDPKSLPRGFDAEIATYRERTLGHHAENRLYKRGLNIAGLVEHEAKVVGSRDS